MGKGEQGVEEMGVGAGGPTFNMRSVFRGAESFVLYLCGQECLSVLGQISWKDDLMTAPLVLSLS